MKECPHCAQPVAELAVVCPSCRSLIDPSVDVAHEPVAEPDRSSAPDYGNFIGIGGVIAVIGLLVMLGSDGSGGETVGWVVMCLGLMVLFVGLVGLGVYIGLRQFDRWQTDGKAPGQP
jgi:hypothetical protein